MSTPQGTTRAELSTLVRLALPITATQLGQMMLGAVDTAVLGRVGERELGAGGLGASLFFSSSVVGLGVLLGLDPLIAQAVGAGERGAARKLVVQGWWLALLAGVPLTVFGVAMASALPTLGIATETAALTRDYLAFRLPSVIPFLAFVASRSYLQALGVTRPLVAGVVTANLVNLPLCVVLTAGDQGLGWLGLPALGLPAFGVRGAAAANTLATVLQLGIAAAAIRASDRDEPGLAATPRAPDPSRLRKTARLGLPIGLTLMAEHGVFLLASVLMGRLGSLALAGHQVALTLAALAFMIPVGLGASASVRVGHAVGRGDTPGARRAGFLALGTVAAYAVASATLFVLVPRSLARLLTSDAAVIELAAQLLLVAAVFQLADGVQAVAAGALRGAGDTRAPLLANLAGHYLVGAPLAVGLGLGLGGGPRGVWWGLAAGLLVVAVVLTARFERLSRREILRV